MSVQKLFEDAIIPVIEQGGPSYFRVFINSCRYRGPNGRKCAIGHLIPDELYNEKIEDKRAFMLPANIKNYIILKYDLEDEDIIDYVQKIHDDLTNNNNEIIHDNVFLHDFIKKAYEGCKNHNVNPSFLDKYT